MTQAAVSSPKATPGGKLGLSTILSRDFTASIVVFLVAMPLCMGIAVASGVPAERGLLTGIIGGIIVGSLAGSPCRSAAPPPAWPSSSSRSSPSTASRCWVRSCCWRVWSSWSPAP